jgi:hypothetical protein
MQSRPYPGTTLQGASYNGAPISDHEAIDVLRSGTRTHYSTPPSVQLGAEYIALESEHGLGLQCWQLSWTETRAVGAQQTKEIHTTVIKVTGAVHLAGEHFADRARVVRCVRIPPAGHARESGFVPYHIPMRPSAA